MELTKETASKKPFILLKYPSRGRPQRFFEGMDSIYNNLYDRENFGVLVTADIDDKEMCNDSVRDRIKSYPNAHVIYGTSKSKVDAINRDMGILPKELNTWDILVVMSDDMRFTFFGWDEIIRNQFNERGLDTLLHLPEPDSGTALAVMYIAGKDFYNRFGWIYNPVYLSLFCDNEIQEIAMQLGKYHFYNCPGMIFHANPAYGHHPKDEMFIQQQQIGWTIDHETYNKRKLINFGL